MATALSTSTFHVEASRELIASDTWNPLPHKSHGFAPLSHPSKFLGLTSARPSPKSERNPGSCRASVSSEHGYDLYELLGVENTASQQEIRRSYRWLQKKCHPDVAGPVGHDMAILLNEAYATLSDPNERAAYDHVRADSVEFEGFTGQPLYSKWFGPANEEKAVFVDECQCVGCLKCALIAPSTFAIENGYGRARAVGQWADPEPVIEDAIKACPVDCITWVDRSKLAALEFTMSKQPRFPVGIDVLSNGGIRTVNVFKAAEKFLDKLRQRENSKMSNLQETPAQREARLAAMEGVQARAGRWWHHFVGKNMAEDQTPANVGRASQGAIIPLTYFKTIAREKDSGSDWRPGGDDGHDQGTSTFPDELEKLFEAAARRRAGSSSSKGAPATDDEYWVPINRISCPVSFSVENNSNIPGQEIRTRNGSYKWSWTRGFSMDEKVNVWVKGVVSGMPVVLSATAAMLVGFTGGTDAALSETEIMGPLPADWTNSLGMQVVLAAAVWYIVGAVLSSAAILTVRLSNIGDKETPAS